MHADVVREARTCETPEERAAVRSELCAPRVAMRWAQANTTRLGRRELAHIARPTSHTADAMREQELMRTKRHAAELLTIIYTSDMYTWLWKLISYFRSYRLTYHEISTDILGRLSPGLAWIPAIRINS